MAIQSLFSRSLPDLKEICTGAALRQASAPGREAGRCAATTTKKRNA